MAIFWAVFGTFLFTLLYASGKFFDGNIHAFQIMFIRFISGFCIMAGIRFFRKGAQFIPQSDKKKFHFARSIAGSMGAVCFIQAATIISIADATALGLTDSLLTILLSILILKERVVGMHWVGIFLCAMGAFVVVRPMSGDAGDIPNSVGSAFALMGALLIAVESIFIKVLSGRESAESVLFYVNGFSTVILCVPAILFWTEVSFFDLFLLVCLGPLAVLAQFGWVRSYQLADAALVTPFNYTWIIFSVIIGYFYFGQALSYGTALGSSLIVLGGIILSSVHKLTSKRNTKR